jgi:hypothetical protein
VILDCCHSTALTRSKKPCKARWKSRVRGRRSGIQIPPSLDKDIWGIARNTRAAKISSRYERTGLGSHVILTACGSKEEALEDCGGGAFTQALLKTLRKYRSSGITYSKLIQEISLPK